MSCTSVQACDPAVWCQSLRLGGGGTGLQRGPQLPHRHHRGRRRHPLAVQGGLLLLPQDQEGLRGSGQVRYGAVPCPGAPPPLTVGYEASIRERMLCTYLEFPPAACPTRHDQRASSHVCRQRWCQVWHAMQAAGNAWLSLHSELILEQQPAHMCGRQADLRSV